MNPVSFVQISQDSKRYVLTIQSLPIDAATARQFTRFPEAQWPHIMSLILSTGLGLLQRLEPNHIEKIVQYHELEEIQRTMPDLQTHDGSEREEELLRQVLRQHIETLFDDWQQRLTKRLDNHLSQRDMKTP